jgi:hypothetical protein
MQSLESQHCGFSAGHLFHAVFFFLLVFLFSPEDGGDVYLQNVGCSAP